MSYDAPHVTVASMKKSFAVVLVVLVVAGSVAGLVWKHHGSPQAKRDRLVREFLTVLPDSLDSEHRLEIQQLFYMFYLRADKGLVAREDIDKITNELADYVKKGRITATDLVHFMAEVGYTTYKGEARYNLPDGSVDNPILNPASATYSLRFDSTDFDSSFWADFKEWKKTQPPPDDSTFWQDSLLQQMIKLQRQAVGRD